jgi:N-acetylmuramoyl-L-alanine amidase
MNKAGCTSARRRVSALRAILFVGCSAAIAAGPNRVSSVRFWSIGDTTRVAVEVSGEFTYKSDRLSNPDRVFFDIDNAVPAVASPIAVGDGLLKQIRVGETRKGVTRVVLDLEPGVEFTASRLANPERLMIELRRKGAPAPQSGAAPAAAASPDPETRPPERKSAEAAVKPALEQARPQAPVTQPQSSPEARVAQPPQKAAHAAPAAPRAQTEAPPEPRPAIRNSNGDRSLTRVLGLKLSRIVLDPGHGGHDQGTHSKSGLLEKDLVLDIAQRTAALLRERGGAEVILTRTDDTFLTLEERTRIANQAQADLFLSIHVNSSPIKSVAGVETYYLNFSASREDLDLATRENAATERTIADFQDVVAKIALRAKLDESREFALRLQQALQKTAAAQNKEAKDRGVKRAPFVVLIGAGMPAVLAEVGFLSNARDEELMKSGEHRDRIAAALAEGIAAYARTLSESQVASRNVE